MLRAVPSVSVSPAPFAALAEGFFLPKCQANQRCRFQPVQPGLGVLFRRPGCDRLLLAVARSSKRDVGSAGAISGRGRNLGRNGRQPSQERDSQRNQSQVGRAVGADCLRLDFLDERHGHDSRGRHSVPVVTGAA